MSENIDMVDDLHEIIHNREQWIVELERQLNLSRAGERVALKCGKELEERLENATKQVRKEVCEEIRQLAIKRNNDQFYIMIDEILDQIQGENK